MEEHAKRFTIGIAAGIVALGAAIGVGMYALFLLQASPSPASYLPAEKTIAYFAHVQSKDLQWYKPWFPSLSTLADFQIPVTLALLNEGGKEQWVVFPEDAQGQMITGEVQSSIPQIETYLKDKTAEKLAAQKYFSLLTKQAPTDKPWAFVDLKHKDPEKTVDSTLLKLLEASPYALFTSEGADQSMTVAVSTPFTSPSVPESLPQVFPSSSFSAAFSSPALFLEHLITALPEQKQDIAWGFLSTFFRTRTGNIQVKEDILPLLKEPGMLLVGKKSASGTVTPFVYKGRMDSKTLSGSLAVLRNSVRAKMPKISVTRHTFEQGFGSTIIQSDPNALQEEVTEHLGWEIRSMSGDGKWFTTAMNGSEFMVGNDPEAVKKLISEDTSPTQGTALPTDSSSTLIAGGVTDLPFLRSFLQTMPVFALESSLFPALEQKTGTATWSLLKRGSLLTLTTRTQ